MCQGMMKSFLRGSNYLSKKRQGTSFFLDLIRHRDRSALQSEFTNICKWEKIADMSLLKIELHISRYDSQPSQCGMNLGFDDGRAQVDLRLQVTAVNTFGVLGRQRKENTRVEQMKYTHAYLR